MVRKLDFRGRENILGTVLRKRCHGNNHSIHFSQQILPKQSTSYFPQVEVEANTLVRKKVVRSMVRTEMAFKNQGEFCITAFLRQNIFSVG